MAVSAHVSVTASCRVCVDLSAGPRGTVDRADRQNPGRWSASTAMPRFTSTRSSATGGRPRSSPGTARSTGSACRTSTRRRCSRGSWTPSAAARSGSSRPPPSRPSGATCDNSNVLETTFATADGRVRVTDAMTLSDSSGSRRCASWCGRSRRSPGRSRCGGPSSRASATAGRRRASSAAAGRWFAQAGADALVLGLCGAGEVSCGRVVGGELALAPGESALFSLAAPHREPAVIRRSRGLRAPARAHQALLAGVGRALRYEGAWPEAVSRSVLALKLLTFAPSGAIVAAPTTSLPEWIGGEPQLGLPLHLAARRVLRARRDAAARLPRRGARLLLVADARLAADPAEAADPLPHRRLRARNELSSPSSRAIAARGRCGSATARATRSSSTSTAGCWRRSGCTRGRSAGSTATPARRSRKSPTTSSSTGATRTTGSGRCATSGRTTSSRRALLGRARPRLRARPSMGLIPDRTDRWRGPPTS